MMEFLLTATHTFPTAGTLTVNDATGTVTHTVATPPRGTTDNVLIRDRRGCVGTVEVTIVPRVARILPHCRPINP
jgi:hypothetical protein